ncbi:MAG: hypothetical protein LBR53_13265 [Deltaproteobacteria bacterium]|jgi:hypothetical protein|nr:hypothetical protein [Deltaproteobacteria bacterium]
MSTPEGKKPRSFKSAPILLPLMIILAAAFLGCGEKETENDAWLSFQLIMNGLFGEKGWSAESHSYANGALTVTGVKAEADPGEKTLPGEWKNPISVKSLTLTDLAPSKDVSLILSSPNWEGKEDKILASRLALKGLESGCEISGLAASFALEALELNQLTLKKAPNPPFPGRAGFLKSLEVAKAAYQGFVFKGVSPGENREETTLFIDSFSLSGLNFQGRGLLEDQSLLNVITSARASQMEWVNVKVDFSDSRANKASFQAESSGVTGQDGVGKYATLLLKDFQAQLDLPDYNLRSTRLKLASYEFLNLDMSDFYRDFFTGVDGDKLLKGDPEALERLDRNSEDNAAVSLLFVHPSAFDSWKINGFQASYNGIAFGADLIDCQGPVKRNVVSPSVVSVRNLYVNLADTSGLPEEYARKVKEFTDVSGDANLSISGDFKLDYDPATGTARYVYNDWKADPLFTVNLAVELSGLTPKFVEALSETPMKRVEGILLIPEFSDFGLSEIDLSYQDRSMVPKILKALAADQGKSPEDYVQDLITRMDALAEEAFPGDPEVKDGAAKAAADFLADPKSLRINVKPESPFTLETLLTTTISENDLTALLNTLGISVSANESDPLRLKFGD